MTQPTVTDERDFEDRSVWTPPDVEDVSDIEQRVAERLAETPRVLGEEPGGPELEEWEVEPPLPPLRVGIVVACWVLAAAIPVGTIFEGFASKIHPAIAGLCGIAVAAQASRRKSALVVNLTILLGVVATGIVLLLPTGLDNVTKLYGILQEAMRARSVQRPPAEYLPGFQLIVGWMMACIGFTAGWVAIELRKPMLGMVASLPLIAMGAISVPSNSKLLVGVISMALMIIGLALFSSLQNLTSTEGVPPSVGYEVRRAVRAVPLIAVLSLVVYLLSKTSFLFPPPYIDPVRDAIRPKAVPLSEVEDKVLFQVRSEITGPWRIGLLDVYAENEWRLPAFAESDLTEVPESGVVDSSLEPGLRADFLVKGLGGAVLPGLPNTVGIIAKGNLAYDPRTGAIRLSEGQIRDGLNYTVTAAGLPNEDGLRAVDFNVPRNLRRFMEMPEPPTGIQSLLNEAPQEPPWDRLEFLRRRLLETVTAAGAGAPVAVPPSKVEDMIFGSKEGSPFEIVAAQAMLARWAGIPARIGYGYDGGEVVGEGVREIRPKHGASWLEVYFQTFKWFPLIGSPLKAKASLTPEGPTNQDPSVLPSEDIAVQVYIPLRVAEKGFLYEQIRRILLLLIPVAIAAFIIYLSSAPIRKAIRRSPRRSWAHALGPTARVEVAYAEWRDYCSDYGYTFSHLTPLAFYEKVIEDQEHLELAWLVTRALYGDMKGRVEIDDATTAEELSRSLRERLGHAHPLTLRAIAFLSRLSIKNSYAPRVRPPTRKEGKVAKQAA